MIGIITESRASAREYMKLEKEKQEFSIKCNKKLEQLEKMLGNAKTDTDKKKIKDAIAKVKAVKKAKLDQLNEKMKQHDKDGYYAMACGQVAGHNHNGRKRANNYYMFKNMGIKYKDNSEKQFMCKEDDKKAKCTKESAEEVDIDDLRMEIYERELTGEITVEEREALLDYLCEKAENKVFSFMPSDCKISDTNNLLEENPKLKSIIKKNYKEMQQPMKEKICELMSNWKTDEKGIKSYSKLKKYMFLDEIIISKTGKEIMVTLTYNSENKHKSDEFFERHSFAAIMYINDSGKVEYEFQL